MNLNLNVITTLNLNVITTLNLNLNEAELEQLICQDERNHKQKPA